MKSLRAQHGPFKERPYYTDSEIEKTCVDELQRVGLLPQSPEPIRIDRFIEKRFGVAHEYEDLPPGLLGYTRFSKSGVAQIVVARSLDDNSVVNDRRVRSTLAHEAGHGLLHAHLFVVTGQSSLFPDGQGASPRVLCRDDRGPGGTKYQGEWWEYQANRTIGGLLLPRQLVLKALKPFLEPVGLLGISNLPRDRRGDAAMRLADSFDVNPIVAVLRLSELFPEQDGAQQTL